MYNFFAGIFVIIMSVGSAIVVLVILLLMLGSLDPDGKKCDADDPIV